MFSTTEGSAYYLIRYLSFGFIIGVVFPSVFIAVFYFLADQSVWHAGLLSAAAVFMGLHPGLLFQSPLVEKRTVFLVNYLYMGF